MSFGVQNGANRRTNPITSAKSRNHIPALDLNLGAELFQRHNREIDRPRTDGAAARHLTRAQVLERGFRRDRREDNKIDDSKFKPELSAQDIVKLTKPVGGIIVFPFGKLAAVRFDD